MDHNQTPGTIPGTQKAEKPGFDWQAFENTEYERRVETVELSNFGDSKDVMPWEICNLNAKDLEAIDVAGQIKPEEIERQMAIFLGAMTTDEKSKTKVVELLFGDAEGQKKTPASLIQKYEIFERGSHGKSKSENRYQTVKFFENFPAEGRIICSKIQQLTALGGMAKKKP